MGASCGGCGRFDGADPRFKAALYCVIAINAVMFLVEIAAGMLAGSQALQADSLDFLGDSLTYGISLAVIGASLRTRALAATVKGISLGCMAAWVLGVSVYKTFHVGLPKADIMGTIGFLALVANLASVALLARWRDGDANVRSVWLCSRNDAIGNLAVMVAASGVWATDSGWPDLIVAAIMAGLFLSSSVQILNRSRVELRETRTLVSAAD